MSKKMFGLLILAAVIFSCARAILPEEKAYMEKVNKTQLSFTIPVDKGEEAWSRANGFVANYSSMRISMANDYTIQTFPPVGSGINYSYAISRVKKGDTWEYNVNCQTNNMFMSWQATRNARILSYYIITGELPFTKFVDK